MLALVLVTLALAAAASTDRYERAGLSVEVPDGWIAVGRPLTPCTDPMQRLALRGRGALVQIQERLGVDRIELYPSRPRTFELRGQPQWIACCAPAKRKGWLIQFRDGGRGFYAYVYVGKHGTRAQVLRILDSLRVGRAAAKS